MTNPAQTIDVGKIKLVWRGTYNSGTSYEVDDLVQYEDGSTISSYICVQNSTGNAPATSGTVNTTYWNLLSRGSNSVSAGTVDGQVQYKNATGFGATNFTYDIANNRVGINTSSPNSTLQVVGVTSTTNLTVTGPAIFSNNISVTGITTLGITTVTDTLSINEVFEKANIVSGTANGTSNLDVKTGSIFLFTSNSTSTWTHNIRGDASTTLNSMLSVGQYINVTVISAQNNSSYYSTDITIDGSAVTEYWRNNSSPTFGKSSGYDAYTWNIIKTGNSQFLVFVTLN